MIDAYLARLGVVRPDVPDIETLFALHRAQVEKIAYENVDIYLGRPPGIEPAETFERIARGRGGYCYQLNGAFATLLAELGFAVTWHVGGVHGESGPVGATGNHLALTVSGLPTADCPDGVWFVDAGLGDALHEPLPLREGVYRQGPFTYGLERSTVIDGWHFTKVMVVARRGPDDVRIVRGVTLTQHDAAGCFSRRLTDQAEWVSELTAMLDLSDVDLDTLWDKNNRDHEAWLAAASCGEVLSGPASSEDAVAS